MWEQLDSRTARSADKDAELVLEEIGGHNDLADFDDDLAVFLKCI